MVQKFKIVLTTLIVCFSFLQNKSHAKACQYSSTRCSLNELIQFWFPDTTGDPNHSLKKKDGHGRLYEFPQLAKYVDNDVSDFSWEKVLYPGETDLTPGRGAPRILKPAWFYNVEDISNWQEDAQFTKVDPENGHFRATNAHWPYGPHTNYRHASNAMLWVVIKAREGAIPTSWYANLKRDKRKRYLARPIHKWRQNPPNCRATGGSMRTKARPDTRECVAHGLRKGDDLQDNEGEFFLAWYEGKNMGYDRICP